MERKLTTILAMDVVGYSRLMERDETGTLERLKDIRARHVDPAVARHSGRIIKLMGDGTLAAFASVVGGLQCAVDIQKELAERNAGVPENHRLQLRMGLHLGDVIIEGDDIYGDGVNVAARLERIAPAGGIVLSRQVHDHIGPNVAVRLVSIGEQAVKNISRPIEAYRVDFEPDARGASILRFDEFELDVSLFQLRKAGARVAVEPQVFDLLVFLARNRDRIVAKDEVFAAIWGDRIVSDAALSSQIKAARRALGDDGASQRMIATVHGRGFRFIPEVRSAPVGEVSAQPESRVEETLDAIRQRPSVVVLPFTNLNSDASEDYLADGITEDIITALAKNRWLTVVARNPAFAFRNSGDSIRTIGKKLEADYVVTGSMRKAGDRYRATIQVVDAETEHSIWSERFDSSAADIFDLQDEISELVASRLEAELGLSEQRKAERKPRKNLGAWDLYQLGCAEFYKFTPEANRRSQELLRESIRLDPAFPGAHARLAYAIILSMVYFDAPSEAAAMDEALAAARRAVELDDQDAQGFCFLGRVHLARQEYDQALAALEHALRLNPCLAVSYCALADSLTYEGRLDEAITNFEVAIRLSPHDPFRWAFYSYRSLAHIFRGEHEAAVNWARRAVQVPNAQYWATAHLVAALGHLGDRSQIERAVADLRRIKPGFSVAFAKEHLFYLKRTEQLETYLDGLRKAGVP
ncbi:MAG: winged helix-turn-helix domain-containing protein [Alphaproteobacteria bacterium]|nr:winged helix-turn-helix domain-containing protein [Alphaproteobacteria bacterium]MCW5741553.1 winged helix-turn-helix domain-containing protein [Alphaproteobacteria bacterium]